MKRCWLNTERGFTLVEIMIASLILAIIISTVYYTYRAASDSQRRAQERLELYQNALAGMENLGQDLRGAFKLFNATSDKIEFITSFNRSHPPEHDYGLTLVKYYCARGLIREEQEADQDQPAGPPAPLLIAPWVANAKFEYSNGSGWFDSWDATIMKALPAAVRVTLVVKNQSDPEQLEQRFVTVIPVLAGVKY